MSILIHGVSMPKKGESGRIAILLGSDGIADVYNSGGIRLGKYICECSVTELPPHGRLGDLDALMAEFERMQTLLERRGHEFACSFMSSSMEISTEWYCVEDAVNAAKTIVPADPEGGADCAC